MNRMPVTLVIPVVLAVLWTAACGGSPRSTAGAGTASPAPTLVVEAFLQAANTNDLDTMMQLFGTRKRTIDELDGRSKAERRMHVLASLLRHDDYAIESQRPLPGRSRVAAEVRVRLERGEKSVVVPWVVVRRDSGGWIIEKIDIEPLTQGD